ncbi:MAG TPA: Rossmann-like and DUF2520 domain-containing protein [Planctomycetota bacterium]|nr:Rossmann-like and DUF2520 domain-containing protein [Planctomycetota bacterium]
MPIRLAIVGPGRVGSALGRRFAAAGVDVLGFVGRRPASALAAVQFTGRGRVLGIADLAVAHVVVLAVGDGDLATAVQQGTAAGPRSCSLWLHTSGAHGLEVLAPLQRAGARIGSLHPATPFPDAAAGLARLAGCPAVLQGEPRSELLLLRLCVLLGAVPLWSSGGDRPGYHAACALAANGLTALASVVHELLATASGLSADDAALVAQSLMAAALAACGEQGAVRALSGPLLRSDLGTVRAHLQALAGLPAVLPIYRALMLRALELAVQRGLPAANAAAMRQLLSGTA